jgi:nitrite reductase (NADH) small subunit
MSGSIVCPWHLWAFDLKTGCSDVAPELQLIRHDVRVEGDRILVRLKTGTEQL